MPFASGTAIVFYAGGTVGGGAIIASQSVVVSDIPAYAVARGSPGKVIRRRFDEKTIALLLSISKWHWDREQLTSSLDVIRGNDIDALEKAVERNFKE